MLDNVEHSATGTSAQADNAGDYLTILQAKGSLILTKRLRLGDDGKLHPQKRDKALDPMPKHFAYRTVRVANIIDLQCILQSLRPNEGLAPGRLKDGCDPNNSIRRKRDGWKREQGKLVLDASGIKILEPATIEDRPSHIVMLDIEGLRARDDAGEFDPVADPERAIACAMPRLPPEFRDVCAVWQLSSSAGTADFNGEVKLHLYFWLSRALTCAQLLAWLKPWTKEEGGIIDGSTLSADHLFYVAPPILPEGAQDPVPTRIGYDWMRSLAVVPVPDDLPEPAPEETAAPEPVDYSDDDRDEARRLLMGISPDKRREAWLPIVMAIRAVYGEEDPDGISRAQQWKRGELWAKGAYTIPGDAQFCDDDEIERVYNSGEPLATLETLRKAAAAEGWPPDHWRYENILTGLGDSDGEAEEERPVDADLSEWPDPADLFSCISLNLT